LLVIRPAAKPPYRRGPLSSNVRAHMQSVSAYLRDGSYFIVVIHGSSGGEPCIASGPVVVLPAGTDAQSLGSAVLTSLGQSTSNVPWPTDWKKVTEPLLLAASVKSWATFAKRASNVRVDRSAQAISVRPCLRDKASFVDLPDKVVHLAAPAAASLGAAVVAALQVPRPAS
jgi:hypothetical protein